MKKYAKKANALLLALVMLLATLTPITTLAQDQDGDNYTSLVYETVDAVNPSAYQGTVERAYSNYHASGFAVSIDDFTRAFTGEPANRREARSLITSGVYLSDIAISGDDVSFVTTLTLGDTLIELPVTGSLYASSWAESSGINSLVIDIPNPVLGYDFLLFEIHNDYTDALFGLFQAEVSGNTALLNNPHVRIYIKSPYGLLYLFEIDIPNEFSNLAVENHPTFGYATDVFWAADFIEDTVEKIPVTDELLESAGHSQLERGLFEWSTWQFFAFRYEHWVLEPVRTISIPRVRYRYTHVSGSNSTWIATFEVANRTYLPNTNTTVSNQHSTIQYRNVTLQFAAGERTTFVRTFYQGVMMEGGAWRIESGELASTLFTNVAANVGGTIGTSVHVAFEILRNAVTRPQTLRLGGDGQTLYRNNEVAVGRRLTNARFYRDTNSAPNGHFFVLNADTSRIGTAPANPPTTFGALLIEFDVYQFVSHQQGYRRIASDRDTVGIRYQVR